MSERSNMRANILAFIRDELKTKGFAPSVQEIRRAVGLRSTCSVARHLEELELRGLIRRVPRKPRSIRLVEETDHE